MTIEHDTLEKPYCVTSTFNYYTMNFYKLEWTSCVQCPARYWINSSLHWCAVKDYAKNHMTPPNCTEYDWDKFVLEYI